MKTTKSSLSITSATFAAVLVAGSCYYISDYAPGTPVVRAVPAPEGVSAEAAAPDATVAEASVPEASVPEAVAGELFSAPSQVLGQRLDVKSAAYMQAFLGETKPPGRVGVVDPASVERIASVEVGDGVRIPLFAGEFIEGVVKAVDTEEEGVRRIGGHLTGERKGSFYFSHEATGASGYIRLPEEKVAYELTPQETGKLQLRERAMVETECVGMPKVPTGLIRPPRAQRATPQPIFNSRPGAPACYFIDFDGVVVNDPLWATLTVSGSPIMDCEPSSFTDGQIRDCWRRVAEDFLMFNINVTTDPDVYAATKAGSRMRCVFTAMINGLPAEDYFAPFPIGGIAILNSFARAGKNLLPPFNQFSLKKNVPCWVFEDGTGGDPKAASDAISHEGGHTFGLDHDGTQALGPGSYYGGHGTGPTSWGPIMGVSYNVSVQHWSKGEYRGANNREDDIAIISNAANGFGFSPDDFGNTPATAAPATLIDGYIQQYGVIGRENDADVFSITVVNGGNLILSANGYLNEVGNCDLRMDLLDSTGVVIAKNTFDRTLGAALVEAVPAGTYYVRIRATGEGDVNATGYSRYGSNGTYAIAGKLP